jgi:hypothetical protein
MVQFLFAYVAAAVAILLLLLAVLLWSQRGLPPGAALSPGRRAALIGGLIGIIAFLSLVAVWAWIAPPH